jgi:ribose transport system permease protein
MSENRFTSQWGTYVRRGLAPSRIGGVYVLLALIVVFSIWVPATFPELATARQILNNNSIAALAALTLVIPMSCGVFDISVPYTMTLSGVITTYTIVHSDLPIWLAVLIGLLSALLVGLVNGFVVVTLRIDSLIGTLATGFLIQAVVSWRTGARTVTSDELSAEFPKLARTVWFWGLTLPVFYVLAVAVAAWFLMEHTATGRRIYATGFNREAARLAGVRTDRLRYASLIISASLAGITGIVLAAFVGSGSPQGGSSYLLPAFAGVFLGATQLKGGRFNAFGTLIAVLLLATGTTGLGLARQPGWVQNLFTGVVLIAALAVTGMQSRQRRAEVEHVDDSDDSDGTAERVPEPVRELRPHPVAVGEAPPARVLRSDRTTQLRERTP